MSEPKKDIDIESVYHLLNNRFDKNDEDNRRAAERHKQMAEEMKALKDSHVGEKNRLDRLNENVSRIHDILEPPSGETLKERFFRLNDHVEMNEKRLDTIQTQVVEAKQLVLDEVKRVDEKINMESKRYDEKLVTRDRTAIGLMASALLTILGVAAKWVWDHASIMGGK